MTKRKRSKRYPRKGAATVTPSPVVVAAPPVDEAAGVVGAAGDLAAAPDAGPAAAPTSPPPAAAPAFTEVAPEDGLTAAPTAEPPPIQRAAPAAAPPPDELTDTEVLEAELVDDATAAAAAAAPAPDEEPPADAAPAAAAGEPGELPDEDVVDGFAQLFTMLNLGALHFGSYYAFGTKLNPATPADLEAGKKAWSGYAAKLAEKLHLTGNFAKVSVWNVRHVLTHHPAIVGAPSAAPDPDDEAPAAAAAAPGDPG